MKHEDFSSLELKEVMPKVLDECQRVVGAKSAHWLSSFALDKILAAGEDTWNWTVGNVDMHNQVITRAELDVWDMFHVWRKVGQAYQKPWDRELAPVSFSIAPSHYAIYPVHFEKKFLGLILLEGAETGKGTRWAAALRPIVELAARYIFFGYQIDEARGLAYYDDLTGLYNQRYLSLALEHEIQRAKRHQAPFSLLFLDVDYFKLVNDGRGHLVGSRLLRELGQILSRQVRGCDSAFRYGGDEFVILLSGSGSEGAKVVAERMRQAVESNHFLIDGQSISLTVSIGLATFPEHAQSAAGLLQLADQAMYHGKRKSRNIVFVAS